MLPWKRLFPKIRKKRSGNMNNKEAYAFCTEALGKADGTFLLEAVAGVTVTDVLTHPEAEVKADLQSAVTRAQNGEPLQYIAGKTEFMSLAFKVTPAVLIPRQDTETLVEFVLSKVQKGTKGLDLCTGSGCIAVALAHYLKADMYALDISFSALEIARVNAKENRVAIHFLQGDAKSFSELRELDFIVSNPPYIETAVVNTLERNVKDFEPRLALDGGEDGLDFYGAIAENSKKMLKTGGILAVEIGFNQGESVKNIFKKVFGNAVVLPDLCGNDRVVYAIKENI